MDWLHRLRRSLGSGDGPGTLDDVRGVLDELSTANADRRDEILKTLASWGRASLPPGASRLVLEAATRRYPALESYPATPNEGLVQLLWSAKGDISPADVATAYPAFDSECQASALRLLARLTGRDASQTLAALLHAAASTPIGASWPVLLPLEREPRDPDLLLPPLLETCSTDAGLEMAGSAVLAYVSAGLVDASSQRMCFEKFGAALERALRVTAEARERRGRSVRWDDEYDGVVGRTGVILDVLGRLELPDAVYPLSNAASHAEPAIALWGIVGLLRKRQDVSERVMDLVAAEKSCRSLLHDQLEQIGHGSRFPAKYSHEASLAEGEMVRWLMFPTELGRAPDDIEPIAVIERTLQEGRAHIHVFKFRTAPPHWAAKHGWMVGIAGPYPIGSRPKDWRRAVTFSQFEGLESMTLDEHVRTLLETVGRFPVR